MCRGNVEYVVHAIREMHRRSGRKISIVGHGQGTFLPYYAMKVWPDLVADVEDFIGVAGLYVRGSDYVRSVFDSGTGVGAGTPLRPSCVSCTANLRVVVSTRPVAFHTHAVERTLVWRHAARPPST